MIWEEIDIEIFGKHDARTWQSNVLTGLPRTGDEGEHEPGGSFAEGDLLFEIEPRDYQLAADQAEAQVAQARYQLELATEEAATQAAMVPPIY